MKKIFVGFMGLLLAMSGANAEIKAATTGTVSARVNTIENGTNGVTSGNTRLTTAEGTAVSASVISNTNVGTLPALTSGSPTQTINANDANIQVLQRDKLSVAGNPNGLGHCESTDKCGYVTTGTHANDSDNKIWMRLTRCSGSGNSITCE